MFSYHRLTPDYAVQPQYLTEQRRSSSSIRSSRSPSSRYSSSPNSNGSTGTCGTSPSRSPPKVHEFGPRLLPRLQYEDERISQPVSSTHLTPAHQRALSQPAPGYQIQNWSSLSNATIGVPSYAQGYDDDQPQAGSRVSVYGSTTAQYTPLVENIGGHDYATAERLSRGSSGGAHARSASTTSINADVLARHGFPTYRESPGAQPNSTVMASSNAQSASAMRHLTPMDGQTYPTRRRTASPPVIRSSSYMSREVDRNAPLPTPQQFSNLRSSHVPTTASYEASSLYGEPMTCMLDYLTARNPAPSLVRRTSDINRSASKHFWFDVRNIRPWVNFNMDAILSTPKFLQLLQHEMPSSDLVTPARVSTDLEDQTDLARLCKRHHAVKVNAALQCSLPEGKRPAMLCSDISSSRHQQPDFVANLPGDSDSTIDGERRGRVVGLVKCYEQWNSRQRNMNDIKKVSYLQGLAHLQHLMRQHRTRYGFIITETELVCVRAGGPCDQSTRSQPLFGYLEVANSIKIETHGRTATGAYQMTADLALWYLHMLAKDDVLPGTMHWRMEVGAPAALSRQYHCLRDGWIDAMKPPTVQETRVAKKNRGWVWPDEPYSKREHPIAHASRVRASRATGPRVRKVLV